MLLAGVTLVAAIASAEQAKPAVHSSGLDDAEAQRRRAPKKLVPPVRGEATIGYLKPVTKQDKAHDRDDDQDQEPVERRDRRPEGR